MNNKKLESEYIDINVFLSKSLQNEMRPIWISELGKKGRTKWIQNSLNDFFEQPSNRLLLESDYIEPTSEALHIAYDFLNEGLIETSAEGTSDKIKIFKSTHNEIIKFIRILKKAPIKATPRTLNKACLIRAAIEQTLAKKRNLSTSKL